MLAEPNYLRVMKWRYLDCLDTTRYSTTEFIIERDRKRERLKHASIEVSATILMGNGIRIPGNQLIDSFGLLRIASEMIKAADEYISKGKNVFLPIEYSHYDYGHEFPNAESPVTTPFLLAAHLFGKADENDPKFFELSAWPALRDERRKEWAEWFEESNLEIPSRLIVLDDPYENTLAKDLVRILNFFTIHPEHVKEARPTGHIRKKMVRYISRLSTNRIENSEYFRIALKADKRKEYSRRLSIILDITKAFRRLEGNDIIDYRTQIRNALVRDEEMYFEGTEGLVANVRTGILKTFNTIYNFSAFRGTVSSQDNQTEPKEFDRNWGYDEAAFTLGQWAREKYSQLDELESDDLSSDQGLYIRPRRIPASFVIGDYDEFWTNFFDYQRADSFVTSLNRYVGILLRLDVIRKQLQNTEADEITSTQKVELKDAFKEYRDARSDHVMVVNKYLQKDRYQILKDGNLVHFDDEGDVDSKVQIEDFAVNADLSRWEKGARYAAKNESDDSVKGRIAEYGD